MIDIENYNPYREECMNLDVIKRFDMIMNGGYLPIDYEPIRVGNYNLDILWRMDTINEMIKNGEFGGGGGNGTVTPEGVTITDVDNAISAHNTDLLAHPIKHFIGVDASGDLTINTKYDIIDIVTENKTGVLKLSLGEEYFNQVGVFTVIVRNCSPITCMIVMMNAESIIYQKDITLTVKSVETIELSFLTTESASTAMPYIPTFKTLLKSWIY
jgi:hypothetical protein